MRLSFRHRVFVGIFVLGTVPLATALVVLILQVRSADPSGARAAIDDIAASGRELFAALDSTALDDAARLALETHIETLADRTTMARRAEVLSRYAAGAAGLAALAVAITVVALSLTLARRWSAYVSAPIEELTDSVRRIELGQEPPEQVNGGGAPEFDALRKALRDMAAALATIRRQEMERERLQAFRETARRVAHEMRGPLTSARLAISQLSTLPAASNEKGNAALEVLEDETRRLEQLAQEFSDFGRLPEGPAAPIDVCELLEGVITATVPEACPVQREIEPDLTIQGHFEPMRRAVQNVLRNAVEVAKTSGIEVRASRVDDDARLVRIEIEDHGPGVPAELRDKIFEPYFTTRKLGTGLGLAMVRQTVVAHGGSIEVVETDGGGATFVMTLPESS